MYIYVSNILHRIIVLIHGTRFIHLGGMSNPKSPLTVCSWLVSGECHASVGKFDSAPLSLVRANLSEFAVYLDLNHILSQQQHITQYRRHLAMSDGEQ